MIGCPTHFYLELFSILSLALFGLFWLIEKVSHEKNPETTLIGMLIMACAAAILWVKFELAVPVHWTCAVTNLILLAAMACIAIHFIVLILRACRVYMPLALERLLATTAVCAVAAYGSFLFMNGSIVQFLALDHLVGTLIQPFWVIVALTLLARWRWKR